MRTMTLFVFFLVSVYGNGCHRSALVGGSECANDSETDTDSDTNADSDSETATDTNTSSDDAMSSDGVYPGIRHTCATKAGTGAVRCWGLNNFGQLGYGNTETIGIVNTVEEAGDVEIGGDAIIDMALSVFSTCALTDDGNVRCWGRNDSGQLGYGNNTDIGDDEMPSFTDYVDLGGEAVQIAAGANHFCALLATGNVRCWGENAKGQLGYGHTENIGDDETPSMAGNVNVGGEVLIIDLGLYFSCALLTTGKVRCWGDNEYGQLGLGNTDIIGDNELPDIASDAEIGTDAVDISCGGLHCCALFDNGKVRCWGDNKYGSLGNGNTDNIGDDEMPNTIDFVDIGDGITSVSAGGKHTCVQFESGDVRCWGDNSSGQLGYGNTTVIGDDETASAGGYVEIGDYVDEMSVGLSHSCVLLINGEIRCWGDGYFGQLGYGNQNNIGDDEMPSTAGDVPVY